MDASTFAPIKVPGNTAPTRPLDRANSTETTTGCSKVPSWDAAKAARRPPLRSQAGGGGGGGSLAAGGTAERDKQAVRIRNTLGAFVEEAEREIGSSYKATIWHKLEVGTGKAYAGALYKYLRYSRINGLVAPREAIKGRMLQLARDIRYELPIKVLLSGLRLAEKMAIIPATVVPADWMFADSLVRLRIS